MPDMVDDGEFWMAWDDFSTHFTTFAITRIFNTKFSPRDQKWLVSYERGEWSLEAHTAGGCINQKDTFLTDNRQIAIRVPEDQVN